MSQISKCPTLRVVLGYWEALGEVSEMRYNNLLYCSSKRSYCSKKFFHTEGMFLSSRRLHFYHLWGKPVSVKGDNPAGNAEDLL